jgi:hypothetical protein
VRAAIACIRFSSDQQADGASIKRQTEIIERHIKLNGLALTAKFTDEGKSAFRGHHLTEAPSRAHPRRR